MGGKTGKGSKMGKTGNGGKTGKGGKTGIRIDDFPLAVTPTVPEAPMAATAPMGGKTGQGGKTGKGGKTGTRGDDLPLAVTPPGPESPRRIEVCTVSGSRLRFTEEYSNYFIHERRQRADFELEELLRPCAEYLRWPLSHIHLVCGETVVRWHRRIVDRTRTFCWQPGEHGVRRVTVVKEPTPAVFPGHGM